MIYRDRAGRLHKAYCSTYKSLWESAGWGSRRVLWLRDQIAENPPESWVYADNLPIRPKLDTYTPSADAKNLLSDSLDDRQEPQ